MLSLALLTRNSSKARSIEHVIRESDLLRLAATLDPTAQHETLRTLGIQDPELVLADLADWNYLSSLRQSTLASGLRARWIGFTTEWDQRAQIAFTSDGFTRLIHEPFSTKELEDAAFDALHEGAPQIRQGLWAFLPAKAGGGCSTLVLNTAGALQPLSHEKVLLIEADARSGSLSMLMNLGPLKPLLEALGRGGEMTGLEWQNYHADLSGIHILPADPSRPGRLPSWADYSQLLHFLERRYRQILVDLPEVVNDATAEVVRRAETVFVVCTPELPSLLMTDIRCQDLLSRGVPRERIRILVTRYHRGDSKDVEKLLHWPVYATLANDYRSVRSSILEARLVSPDSTFGKDCRTLAQMLMNPNARVRLSPLERLSRLIAN